MTRRFRARGGSRLLRTEDAVFSAPQARGGYRGGNGDEQLSTDSLKLPEKLWQVFPGEVAADARNLDENGDAGLAPRTLRHAHRPSSR